MGPGHMAWPKPHCFPLLCSDLRARPCGTQSQTFLQTSEHSRLNAQFLCLFLFLCQHRAQLLPNLPFISLDLAFLFHHISLYDNVWRSLISRQCVWFCSKCTTKYWLFTFALGVFYLPLQIRPGKDEQTPWSSSLTLCWSLRHVYWNETRRQGRDK